MGQDTHGTIHDALHAEFGRTADPRVRQRLIHAHEKVVRDMAADGVDHVGDSLLDRLSVQGTKNRAARFIRTLGGLLPDAPGDQDEVRVVLAGTDSCAAGGRGDSFGVVIKAANAVVFVDPGPDAGAQADALLDGDASKVTAVVATCADDPVTMSGVGALEARGFQGKVYQDPGTYPVGGSDDMILEGRPTTHGVRKALALVLSVGEAHMVIAPRTSSSKELVDIQRSLPGGPDMVLVGAGRLARSFDFLDALSLWALPVGKSCVACFRSMDDAPEWERAGAQRGVRRGMPGDAWVVTPSGVEAAPVQHRQTAV